MLPTNYIYETMRKTGREGDVSESEAVVGVTVLVHSQLDKLRQRSGPNAKAEAMLFDVRD